jgi:hypothetical protein
MNASIVSHIYTFTGDTVRNRYKHALSPGIRRDTFSDAENQQIMQHAAQHAVNPHWDLCATKLQGRTGDCSHQHTHIANWTMCNNNVCTYVYNAPRHTANHNQAICM